MRSALTLAVIGTLLVSLPGSGRTRESSASPQPLPRDLEIKLALSALPPHLRAGATAYVRNPEKGFEVGLAGTNGFHALVARTGDDAMRGPWALDEYPKDVLYPISFDSAGAEAQMRVFFDIAAMQARGTRAKDAKRTIQERYKAGYYRAPGRAGISYMLSPILRTYTNPDENDQIVTASVPHVMYYAPHVSSADVGGAVPGSGPYPFVILHGIHGYNVQFVGVSERAAIVQEYQEMLDRLCGINSAWCLDTPQRR
jgi:hypothetical protein